MSKEVSKPFLWRTMKGEVLRLDQMDTKHLFNILKMIYNHLAEQYDLPPIWFTVKYPDYQVRSKLIPRHLAKNMCVFIAEIERRNDLPDKYKAPYERIVTVLKNLGIKLLNPT